MSNDYFNHIANRVPAGVIASNLHIDNVADEVAAGLDKLPSEVALNQNSATFATDTGVANAYAISLVKITALSVGLELRFLAANDNTNVSTLDVSALGALPLRDAAGGVLEAGDVLAGQVISATYNGTEFRITSNIPQYATRAETAADNAETSVGLAASQVTLAATQVTLATAQVGLATTQASDSADSAVDALNAVANANFDGNVVFGGAVGEIAFNLGASTVITLADGSYQYTSSLNGVTRTYSLSLTGISLTSGRAYTVTLELLNAGSATSLNWPAGVKWTGGLEPAWSTGIDIATFITRDGGTTWYGFLGGLNLS